MTREETKRALGVLIDGLVVRADCQELLVAAGLAVPYSATKEDIEQLDSAAQIGDPWYELTEFAKECRQIARDSK